MTPEDSQLTHQFFYWLIDLVGYTNTLNIKHILTNVSSFTIGFILATLAFVYVIKDAQRMRDEHVTTTTLVEMRKGRLTRTYIATPSDVDKVVPFLSAVILYVHVLYMRIFRIKTLQIVSPKRAQFILISFLVFTVLMTVLCYYMNSQLVVPEGDHYKVISVNK